MRMDTTRGSFTGIILLYWPRRLGDCGTVLATGTPCCARRSSGRPWPGRWASSTSSAPAPPRPPPRPSSSPSSSPPGSGTAPCARRLGCPCSPMRAGPSGSPWRATRRRAGTSPPGCDQDTNGRVCMEPEISLGILHLYIDRPMMLCMKPAVYTSACILLAWEV